MKKLCARCKQPVLLEGFYRNAKSKDGRGAYCKPCVRDYARQPGQVRRTKANNAAYVLSDAQKAVRAAREKTPERKAARKALRDRSRQAEYDKTRRAHRTAYKKTEAGKAGRRRRENAKYWSDAEYRLACCVSAALVSALKGEKKGRRSFDLLPYGPDLLRERLESTWTEGMDWDNYGEWQIDHIKPQSLFDQLDPYEFGECWGLENLQALWARDNREKSDNYHGP